MTLRAQVLARAVGLLSVLIGATVLLGWYVESDALKGAIGASITMKTNAALCFVLAGLALALDGAAPRTGQRRAAQVLGALVAALGGATFLEHITSWNLGIDQLLFSEPEGQAATASPNRMGPPASISFLCVGLGVLLLDWRIRGAHPFRYLPLVAVAIGVTCAIGYLSQTAALYSRMTTGIAWPTAIVLATLGLGVLCSRPETAPVRVLCRDDAGGRVARMLLAPAVGLPVVVLVAQEIGARLGWFSPSIGVALMAVSMILALTTLVLWAGHRLGVDGERAAAADRQRRRHEAELRDLFENASVGLHCVNVDGVILRANQADLNLLGYSANDFVGRPITEFHADPQVPREVMRRLQAGESVHDVPARLVARDGSIKEVLIDSSACWEDGRLMYTRCFTRDVSVQRRVEQVNAQLAAIVESSSDAIVSKDLNGIVTSWNRSAERMFGYTAEEMVGRSITTIIPPEREHEELEILQKLRRGERIEMYQAIRVRKDGTRVAVSLTISPIRDATGNIVGASKIARDLTETERAARDRESLLESERAARAEAERATRSRDDFLAVVSHELRTPLNSILGWAQLLKHSRYEPTTVDEGIEAIERGARAQVQLIEDLLDMNRIMSGKLTLAVKPVDAACVLKAAIDTLRPSIQIKGLTLDARLDAKVGPVLGDPARLQQVFWNLLSNAIKFTPKGGSIHVGLAAVDSHAEVLVRDTGVGIKPDFLPHVFQRFRQADASTTRMYGGLGLGLSIVKNLVELHGGTVSVSSEGEGRGTSFTVRLPLAPAAGTEPAALAPPSLGAATIEAGINLAQLRILVVEDDSEARELVRRILSHCQAIVTTASGGLEALKLIAAEAPDVLVSDIGMPKMDGFQLIRRVRELEAERGGRIPAVALTAYTRSEDRTRAMLAGFQAHIAKPVEPQELAATIASVAGRTTRRG